MEARCCIAPKDCIQKEDVLAYVRPKPLLHSIDVPYARLFFFVLLWFRAKEEVVRFETCVVVAKENQNVCVITYKHIITPRSRLHGCLYLGHWLEHQVPEEPRWHQQGLARVLLEAGERNRTELVGSCIVHD